MICDGYRHDGIVFINEDVKTQTPETKPKPKPDYHYRNGLKRPKRLGQASVAKWKSPADPPPSMTLADRESLALPNPFASLDLSGFREVWS